MVDLSPPAASQYDPPTPSSPTSPTLSRRLSSGIIQAQERSVSRPDYGRRRQSSSKFSEPPQIRGEATMRGVSSRVCRVSKLTTCVMRFDMQYYFHSLVSRILATDKLTLTRRTKNPSRSSFSPTSRHVAAARWNCARRRRALA